jgi:hypothetical protein
LVPHSHPVATYKHREPDDFAHAEVYATLATIRARLSEVEVLYIAVGPGGLQAIEPKHSDYAPR